MSLKLELPLLSARIDGYMKGLQLLPAPSYDSPDLEHVGNCLCVLESKLLQSPSDSEGLHPVLLSVQKELADGLPAALVFCQVLSMKESGDAFDGTWIVE